MLSTTFFTMCSGFYLSIQDFWLFSTQKGSIFRQFIFSGHNFLLLLFSALTRIHNSFQTNIICEFYQCLFSPAQKWFKILNRANLETKSSLSVSSNNWQTILFQSMVTVILYSLLFGWPVEWMEYFVNSVKLK